MVNKEELVGRLVVTAYCVLVVSCAGPSHLSEVERSKLDPALVKLLSGERIIESDYDTGLRKDGTREYAVIIRSDNVEELKSAGILPGSVFGDVVTARVSVRELRKILSLASVRAVECGSKNHPN
jgi:hypothetical protein